MPAARSVAIALSAAVLALPGAALGQGSSGAGDDQYTDPLGGGGTSQPTTSGSQTGGDDLSQTPDLGGSGAPAPPPAPDPSAAVDPQAAEQLPNTGTDPREIVLAGLALLLCGLGLRLRTADEVF